MTNKDFLTSVPVNMDVDKLMAITLDSFAEMIVSALRRDGFDLTADLIELRVARYRDERGGYPEELPSDMEPTDEELESMSPMDLWHYDNGVGM